MKKTLALLVVALSAVTATSQAQVQEAYNPGEGGGSTQQATSPTTTAPPAQPATEPAPMSDPMGSFGLNLRLGLAGAAARDARFDGDNVSDIPSDVGLLFDFGLNLGDGHGFGVDLNLALRRFKNDYDVKHSNLTFEPIFGGRMQLIDPLYLFIGAGPRFGIGWVDVEDARKSAVFGVRLPVQVTYYFLPFLGAVFEFGIGWDVQMQDQNNFGTNETLWLVHRGLTYDFAVGLRFF